MPALAQGTRLKFLDQGKPGNIRVRQGITRPLMIDPFDQQLVSNAHADR
jgi:hypothetical protein